MANVSPKPEQKPLLGEVEAARQQDAYALAQLLLDIWSEKKRKEAINGTTI